MNRMHRDRLEFTHDSGWQVLPIFWYILLSLGKLIIQVDNFRCNSDGIIPTMPGPAPSRATPPGSADRNGRPWLGVKSWSSFGWCDLRFRGWKWKHMGYGTWYMQRSTNIAMEYTLWLNVNTWFSKGPTSSIWQVFHCCVGVVVGTPLKLKN